MSTFQTHSPKSTDVNARTSEEELLERRFVDASSAILMVLDERLDISYCNARGSEILGYGRDELLGGSFLDSLHIHDEHGELLLGGKIEKMFRDPSVPCTQSIMRGQKKNGAHIWIFWNFMQHRDSQGNLLDIYCVGRDLTSLKNALTRFHLTAQGIGFGQWSLCINSGEGYGSPQWYALRGLAEDHQKPFKVLWTELIHTSDFPSVHDAISTHVRGEANVFTAQYRVKHPQKGWIWIRSTGHISEWNESGTPTWISGFDQDVSQEIYDRDELKQNQELLEEAIRIGQMGYWVYDYATNKIESISQTMGNLLDLNLEINLFETEQFFNTFEAAIHPEDRRRILNSLFSPLNTETRTDCRLMRSSGQIVYLHIFSHPILDEAGRVVSQVAIFQDMTEQKKIENALRERQLSLLHALRASRAEFWQYDPETSLFEITGESFNHLKENNDSGEQIDLEDLVRRWIHPEDCDWVLGVFHDALFEESTYEFECRVIDRKGQIRYTRQSGVINRESDEKPAKILGVVFDISDIKTREREIQESEARYRILFDQSFDAVAVFEDEKIVQCNSRAVELFRAYDKYQLIAQSPRILFPERQSDGTLSHEKFSRMMNLCVHQHVEPFTWTSRRLDGTEFESSISLSPVPGAHSLIYVMIRDITEQKTAARALEYYRSYLAILAELRNFFYGRTEKEIIAAFLESATNHFGIAKAWFGFLHGNSIRPTLHAGEAQGFVDVIRVELHSDIEKNSFPLAEAIKEKKAIVYNNLDELNDQSPWSNFLKRSQFRSLLALPFEVKGVLEGGLVFYSYEAGTFDDSIFEYLQSGVREFSRIISEKRIRELQQRALEQAKEKAEIAAKAKTQFLANMSHEIRTPMTAILGFAEILTDPLNSKDYLIETAQVIQSNAKYLLQILNDILDFSKMEEEKMTADIAPVHLPQLLSEIYTAFSSQAAEKEIAFTIKNSSPIPQVILSDSLRLKQILINLMGNAVKFTDSGGVEMTVSWKEDKREIPFPLETGEKFRPVSSFSPSVGKEARNPISREGRGNSDEMDSVAVGGNFLQPQSLPPGFRKGKLHFSVVDTGIGISRDQVHQIFSPFNQADSSTTRKFGGTGLGLAISQRLVRMLQGKLTVQSELGKGSEFSVDLPLEVSEETPFWESLFFSVDEPEKNTVIGREGGGSSESGKAAIPRLGSKRASKPTYSVRSSLVDRVLSKKETLEDSKTKAPYKGIPKSEGTEPEPAEVPSVPKKETVEVPKPQPLKGLRILLAEDGRDNQRLFSKILSSAGAEVSIADNGLISLKFINEEQATGSHFDLILMDMQMPVMDGYTATRTLREQGFHGPIVALTAHAMHEERKKCIDSGCDDYATKPIMREELIRAILKNIEAKKTPEDFCV